MNTARKVMALAALLLVSGIGATLLFSPNHRANPAAEMAKMRIAALGARIDSRRRVEKRSEKRLAVFSGERKTAQPRLRQKEQLLAAAQTERASIERDTKPRKGAGNGIFIFKNDDDRGLLRRLDAQLAGCGAGAVGGGVR